MTRLNRRFLPLLVLSAALCLVPPPSLAAEDTVTSINSLTGQTESAWIGLPSGATTKEVYHSVLLEGGWIPAERVTTDSSADHMPCLAFGASGERRMSWWKADGTDRIMYSSQAAAGGAWTAPVIVSDTSENARSPRVVEHAGTLFVAYEGLPSSGGRRVIVAGGDGSDPWPRTILATLTGSGGTAPAISSASGHLWVHWVDSNSQMGFAEYVNGVWGSVLTESYSGTSDIEPARARIRDRIVN